MTILVILVVVFVAVTMRLFVFPATGMPARVDAIVVLGGTGNRIDYARQLAAEGRTHIVMISDGAVIPPGLCGQHTSSLTIICFMPTPMTTQGEAEAAARIARQHGWDSLAIVTSPDQIWRAELRFRRCFSGRLYGVTTPMAAIRWWPHEILYEWGATIKAEVDNRAC